MNDRFFEADKFAISIEEGIMIFRFRKKATIGLEDARKIVADRKEFSGNETYPVLVELKELKSVDKEARDYFALQESRTYISAAALLVESFFGRLIGNVFLNFNKPPLPAKLFTDRDEAVKWLQQYKQ